jgi:hypothetical protein
MPDNKGFKKSILSNGCNKGDKRNMIQIELKSGGRVERIELV